MPPPRPILVTGGNQGIGFALCKQLATQDACRVFLGSRNKERGEAAVASILADAPDAAIELLQVDVSSDESVAAAAAALKERLGGALLHALVNNAGVGLAQAGASVDMIFDVNLYGTKRVTEAFLPMLDQEGGARVVNLGSGAASMWMAKQDKATQAPFMDPAVTWAQIEAAVASARTDDPYACYGLSKAALAAYTMECARLHPSITWSSVSPGFIATAMTANFGATKPPEEGTVSIRHCLFQPLRGNGWYYGSDAKRSPLDVLRNPGEPEYDP